MLQDSNINDTNLKEIGVLGAEYAIKYYIIKNQNCFLPQDFRSKFFELVKADHLSVIKNCNELVEYFKLINDTKDQSRSVFIFDHIIEYKVSKKF